MPITAMVVLMRGMGVLLVYSGSIPEPARLRTVKRMVKFETRREETITGRSSRT
jgi:hypothetical protein